MSYQLPTASGFHAFLPRTRAWASGWVAFDEPKRIQGLHGRSGLGPNEGMLFFFPKRPPPISMTMAKMLIPLDFVFIDTKWEQEPRGIIGTISHIAHKVPAGRQAPVLGPATPFVLELPSGFARRHRMVRGDIALLSLVP